ncbi:hypothetical protein BpHYR1_014688 [Brachionus plicatilis]|uniref:Uncharacterized protein n=1 Tax=Brachionus plicatilis TaxID=10195 RepID=A0A3M7RHV4_BRAPC|nr:hypothetical protein BpHYR1_014688 [Brachionus plicatilis]
MPTKITYYSEMMGMKQILKKAVLYKKIKSRTRIKNQKLKFSGQFFKLPEISYYIKKPLNQKKRFNDKY